MVDSKQHYNPFLGRCIHGKKGAGYIKGVLFNPKCGRCRELHPNIYKGDKTDERLSST